MKRDRHLKIMSTLFALLLFVGFFAAARADDRGFPMPSGPYLGQKPPGTTLEIFASGFISTGLNEAGIAFMPDGRECYWTVMFSGFETLLTSRLENGSWTEPEVAPFSGQFYDGWPAIQPNGQRMFFHSSRPNAGTPATFNIWYVDRAGSGWSEPQPIGAPVNGSENSTCPSVTQDGTIYISKRFADGSERICRSRPVNGKYGELEVLPAVINTTNENFHAYIAPDESYLVRPVHGRADAIGGGWNYYVSFRSRDDRWSDLINLGPGVNSDRCTGIPSISADGKYMFLQFWTPPKQILALERKHSLQELVGKENRYPSSYSTDIYWISTKVIEELKPKELK